MDRKSVTIEKIWMAQHPFMHSWLVVSFLGLVLFYFAMNLTMV